MARLGHFGAEIDALNSGIELALNPTGTVTRDTTVKRSGAASWKLDSGASNLPAYIFPFQTVSSTGTWYIRAYFRFPATPGSAQRILTIVGPPQQTNNPEAELQTDGTVRLWTANALQTGASVNICDGNWHRVELKAVLATNLLTASELQVDGISVATWSGSVSQAFNLPQMGFNTPGANFVCNIDDVAMNDGTGSAQNSWCGDGKVILMKPTSDTQRGSWTGGAGGTTNLWNAVDNTPPIGTATETDLTQIESADSSGDNTTDEYRGNCGSYAAAGIAAGDTVNSLIVYCCHGEDVSTGTKSGVFGPISNPADGNYPTTFAAPFTFGADNGALATYPSVWTWTANTYWASAAPSVVIANDLILGVRKTDTGTRVGSVCFLGALVDYTPAAVADLPPEGPMTVLQAVQASLR